MPLRDIKENKLDSEFGLHIHEPVDDAGTPVEFDAMNTDSHCRAFLWVCRAEVDYLLERLSVFEHQSQHYELVRSLRRFTPSSERLNTPCPFTVMLPVSGTLMGVRHQVDGLAGGDGKHGGGIIGSILLLRETLRTVNPVGLDAVAEKKKDECGEAQEVFTAPAPDEFDTVEPTVTAAGSDPTVAPLAYGDALSHHKQYITIIFRKSNSSVHADHQLIEAVRGLANATIGGRDTDIGVSSSSAFELESPADGMRRLITAINFATIAHRKR